MTESRTTALTNYDAARSALQKAHRVDEVKSIRDRAEAIRVYARQANDRDMQDWATEIKLRAERRAAELIIDQQRSGVLASKEKGRPQKSHKVVRLSDLGISHNQSAKWQRLAAVPEPEFERIVAETKGQGELTTAAVLREVVQRPIRAAKEALTEKIRNEPPPPPSGPFRVMVLDPPWKYESRAEDTTHRARNPFPDMTADEIKALPVQKYAHPDGCVLWLWTTNAFLREAFACVDVWGFEHKTMLTWGKDRMGTGDWLRGRTEHCLMAITGRPIIELTNQTTLLLAPLREHSRKPEEFYSLVKSLCPGNIVEWFAREAREGITAIYSGELGRFAAVRPD